MVRDAKGVAGTAVVACCSAGRCKADRFVGGVGSGLLMHRAAFLCYKLVMSVSSLTITPEYKGSSPRRSATGMSQRMSVCRYVGMRNPPSHRADTIWGKDHVGAAHEDMQHMSTCNT